MTTSGVPTFQGRQTKKPARGTEEGSETKASIAQHEATDGAKGTIPSLPRSSDRGKGVSLWVHW